MSARRRSRHHHTRTTTQATSSTLVLEKLGVARYDLNDPYHFALSLSWPQFFAALVLAYLAVNLAFALLYFAAPGSISNLPPDSLPDAFFFSVETLATVGYGFMAPATRLGHLIATVEIFVGMLFTATTTGLVFVRFSRPKARILFADHPLVLELDGKQVLMIRIGNGRTNALADATARVTALVVGTGPDGQPMRRPVDLKLVRTEFAYFPFTWTLIHEMDENSPLRGLASHSPGFDSLLLMVNITARDPSLAAQVHAARAYVGADLLFDMHYADAVSWDGADSWVADMRKISEVQSHHSRPANQIGEPAHGSRD